MNVISLVDPSQESQIVLMSFMCKPGKLPTSSGEQSIRSVIYDAVHCISSGHSKAVSASHNGPFVGSCIVVPVAEDDESAIVRARIQGQQLLQSKSWVLSVGLEKTWGSAYDLRCIAYTLPDHVLCHPQVAKTKIRGVA
ncbi:hypothetical protein Mapa_015007 [Marchantia paleacea]|nr:hypothetical protein Mapa_015007 [Marchantia paleacea]